MRGEYFLGSYAKFIYLSPGFRKLTKQAKSGLILHCENFFILCLISSNPGVYTWSAFNVGTRTFFFILGLDQKLSQNV